ncbi:hypothetical protein [Halobaculum sp. D14]|uniref:hypothetical protein n=1 Tax=Halobaculum sp. D14 TaxID=3421642 RepID=UPI003EBAE5C4
MHRPAIDDDHIADAVERSGFGDHDVRVGLRVVHDAVRDRLTAERERSADPDRLDHHVREAPGSSWFAFDLDELRDAVTAAGYELDEGLLAVVAAVNLAAFQAEYDRTLAFPRSVTEDRDQPFFFPVYVETGAEPGAESGDGAVGRGAADDGAAGTDAAGDTATAADALDRIGAYLDAGADAAAALDAYAVSDAGADPADWAARRGVDPDTVRANADSVAAAVGESGSADGTGTDAGGAAGDAAGAPETYPSGGIEAVPASEAPNGVYDPETDRLFIPTDDQLQAARDVDDATGLDG